MKKAKYTTEIKAPRSKVWQILWGNDTYPQWATAFAEGSKAITDWQEGSKVQFVGESGEGMLSVIEKKVPDEFMSFKHVGEFKDGKEMPMSDKIAEWAGSTENYTLSGEGNTTTLTVDIDISESHEDYFNEAFPKALAIVKQLSEQ